MFSSPARPVGSAPPSFPSSSAPAIRSSGSPARMPRPRPSTAAGAEVQRGTLDDLDTLRDAAAASDGVIHLAFKHELAFSGDFQGAADADRRAVEAFGEALAGTDRPFVIASGIARALTGTAGDRTRRARTPSRRRRVPAGPRLAVATAELTLSFAARGVRSSIMRLAPTVHGDGDTGFVATLVDIARTKGVVRLHRRRVEPLARRPPVRCRAPVPSRAGIGAGGIDAARDRRRGRADPRHRRGDRAAPRRPGGLGRTRRRRRALHVARATSSRLDSPASSALTRELLGWQPTQPGLIDDLEQGHYFT